MGSSGLWFTWPAGASSAPRQSLLAEQLKTHAVLSNLKRTMSGEPPRQPSA
ncbi:MAG: hypothetical protein JNJ59_14635 [Deltaproteobacteria bacterium]|jgi:hypothetical protein|nr:hypothetical protein [Deltaproteobacteria bacterium]